MAEVEQVKTPVDPDGEAVLNNTNRDFFIICSQIHCI